MSPLTVIKIGGSVLTDRRRYRAMNTRSIDDYGDFIFGNRSAFDNCIIVLGGGSFGNIIPHRYSLYGFLDATGITQVNLARMTIGMFELASTVCDRWAEKKIGCYPINTSSVLFRNSQGDPELLNASIIRRLLDNKIIPVMTGDLIFVDDATGRKYEIFSSDFLPEVLSKYFDVSRVIMLTDVDGVLDRVTGRVFEEINSCNVEEAVSSAIGSEMQDVTGGMATKLRALIELSRKGIDSFICNGTKMSVVEAVVLSEVCPGTRVSKEI